MLADIQQLDGCDLLHLLQMEGINSTASCIHHTVKSQIFTEGVKMGETALPQHPSAAETKQ